MIKIEKNDIFGWVAAVRGMRNPMNSWDKSDSDWMPIDTANFEFVLGKNDLKLMQSLAKAGDDHAKFLRMINVTADITAPRYWWTEFDTYKVGTVANSCSTMHKITAKPIELSDFSLDDFEDGSWSLSDGLRGAVLECERLRQKYLDTDDERYWRGLIQLLPQSYNQKRTVQLNYQVLQHMYFARRYHKLSEWREFCAWVLGLPYFEAIVIQRTEA